MKSKIYILLSTSGKKYRAFYSQEPDAFWPVSVCIYCRTKSQQQYSRSRYTSGNQNERLSVPIRSRRRAATLRLGDDEGFGWVKMMEKLK